MIHQFIFAAPKPGMSEEAFQDYWLTNHAINFAAKIPQIKKYKLDLRIPTSLDKGTPLFSGMAEIWLNNDEEQLASLQTPEFLQGARLDEPNWAAFWQTQVLDTDLKYDSAPEADAAGTTGAKAIIISKRKNGLELADFRTTALESEVELLKTLPGISRFTINFVRDSWYFLGEPRFDLVISVWFPDKSALEKAFSSDAYKAATAKETEFINSTYQFPFFVGEHWIIGPEPRA